MKLKREDFTFLVLVACIFFAGLTIMHIIQRNNKAETIYHLPNGHDYTMVKRGNDVYFRHHEDHCIGCADVEYIYDYKKDTCYVKYDSVGFRGVVYHLVKPDTTLKNLLKSDKPKRDTIVIKEPAKKLRGKSIVIDFDTTKTAGLTKQEFNKLLIYGAL